MDYLTVDEQGIISIDELKEKLREETIFVSIMHVNNEIGTIQPIAECARVIKEDHVPFSIRILSKAMGKSLFH